METGRVHGAVRPVRPAADVEWLASGQLRAVADALPGQVREALAELPPPVAVAGSGAWIQTAPAFFDLFMALPLAAVQQGDPDAAAAVVHLRDDNVSRESKDYRRIWNGVLRLFNLLQFLPGAWWTTPRRRPTGRLSGVRADTREPGRPGTRVGLALRGLEERR